MDRLRLRLAGVQLDAVGVEGPLQPGETTGVYTTGVVWRLAADPVETAADRGRAFRILLEGWDAAGKPLLRLETFKLGLATN
jgi:hypothetical protein